MTGACCVTRILYTLHDIASHTTCPPPYRWSEVADQRRGEIEISDWLGGMWSARPGELSLVEGWSLAPFPLQESVEITGVDILRTSPPTVGDQH